MNPLLTGILVCPHCGGDLRENGGALICSAGHTANVARQGYVSLLGRHSGTHTADSAVMIAARERFLARGHFQPIVDAVVAEVGGAVDREVSPPGAPDRERVLIDLGAGTGYYLAAALASDEHALGLGIDNSKYAARRAARCHPRAGAVVADIWDDLPVRTGAATVVLNVFAPRNGEEIRRILAPGGTLIVVTPVEGHLNELSGPFEMISIDPEKESRLEETLGHLTGRRESRLIEWSMDLDRGSVTDLVGMGPNAGRLEPAGFQAALERLPDPAPVSGAVRITSAVG